MKIKILSNYAAAFLFTLAFCPQSFAQTPECDKAMEICKTDCSQRPIYDNDRQGYLRNSDFLKRCRRACSGGGAPCKVQDSENSCNTFNYHCISACPRKVMDTTNKLLVKNSDSFEQCSNSCAAGTLACKPLSKRTYPRKRMIELNRCEEAQRACYSSCTAKVPIDQNTDTQIESSNFSVVCVKACNIAVPSCKAATEAAAQCDAFFESCTQLCPGVITLSDESENPNTNSHSLCTESCRDGRMYCRDLAHLLMHEDDLDAREAQLDQ